MADKRIWPTGQSARLPNRTPVTNAFVIACMAVHLILFVTNRLPWAYAVAGFLPIRLDALLHGVIVHDMVPFVLTPLTASFLHGDIMHLVMNMLLLLFIGRLVEPLLGPKRMLILLVVGAYAAAFVHALFDNPMIPMIGASGAISALIATYAMIYRAKEVRAIGPFSGSTVYAIWIGVAWIGIQLLSELAAGGMFGNIAVYAHIGGFLAGLLMTRPLLRSRFRT